MAILADRRQEAFAQALARGVRAPDAFTQAGYPCRKNAARLFKNKRITDRVPEIVKSRTWGGSRDLVGLIDKLREAFDRAMDMKGGAAMMAAKAIIAEAARLKQLLPMEEEKRVPRIQTLSNEEWTRRYGPQAS